MEDDGDFPALLRNRSLAGLLLGGEGERRVLLVGRAEAQVGREAHQQATADEPQCEMGP